MTNPMTEKQAWLTIAEAYGTLRGRRSKKQRELAMCGICHAITESTVQDDLRPRMREKVYRDLDSGRFGAYFCVYNRANDKLRADYCRLNYYMLGGTRC